MKVIKNIVINASANKVWKTVAEDFDKAHIWMSIVHHSHAIDEGESDVNAPMKGRVCELSKKPNGLYANEIITHYSKENKSFTFEVIPMNAPALLPIKKNIITILVKDLGSNKSEVIWTSVPELKALGKIMSPILKVGLGKAFKDILKELKDFCETAEASLLKAA